MVSNKKHKVMKSISSWNLTNNKLHQLFKDNKEFISIIKLSLYKKLLF